MSFKKLHSEVMIIEIAQSYQGCYATQIVGRLSNFVREESKSAISRYFQIKDQIIRLLHILQAEITAIRISK